MFHENGRIGHRIGGSLPRGSLRATVPSPTPHDGLLWILSSEEVLANIIRTVRVVYSGGRVREGRGDRIPQSNGNSKLQ